MKFRRMRSDSGWFIFLNDHKIGHATSEIDQEAKGNKRKWSARASIPLSDGKSKTFSVSNASTSKEVYEQIQTRIQEAGLKTSDLDLSRLDDFKTVKKARRKALRLARQGEDSGEEANDESNDSGSNEDADTSNRWKIVLKDDNVVVDSETSEDKARRLRREKYGEGYVVRDGKQTA